MSLPVHNSWFGVDVNAIAGLEEPLRLTGRVARGNFAPVPIGQHAYMTSADATVEEGGVPKKDM